MEIFEGGLRIDFMEGFFQSESAGKGKKSHIQKCNEWIMRSKIIGWLEMEITTMRQYLSTQFSEGPAVFSTMLLFICPMLVQSSSTSGNKVGCQIISYPFYN